MTLIGPKPDVDVPDLPTPWTSQGDAILDANGRCVLVVNNAIAHLDRHLIAKVVAGTINLAHSDPLAHVKLGDPDPTPDDVEDWCESKDPLGGPRGCRRAAGHPGQHIAANGSRVVAVWRDDV